jgi:hypothetical protein
MNLDINILGAEMFFGPRKNIKDGFPAGRHPVANPSFFSILIGHIYLVCLHRLWLFP